jgi:O-antigen biosynthesis protein WbqP
MRYKNVKRIADFLLSLIGLVILSPLFVLIAVLIRCDSAGPIFFRQTRLGKDNRTFTIYKFRTMYQDAPDACPTDQLDQPDRYITKVGKCLRATSLDELPQLLNVLKGNMSLVGPRPFIANELEMIRLRNETGVTALYPGLTGWAQITGGTPFRPSRKSRMMWNICKR